MGLYADLVLPRLLEWGLGQENVTRYRRNALAAVRGEVLEIGFGTGLNLPHYPEQVRKLTTVDVNPAVAKLARKRIAASPIAVDHRTLNGERLPFADDTFDGVVSTFTLCSIGDVRQALREIRRVLKPGGCFFFVEHGLSDDPKVQAWQHRLTPLQRIVAGGCHFDRDIAALIAGQGFEILRLDRSYMDNTPRVSGYLYQGVVAK